MTWIRTCEEVIINLDFFKYFKLYGVNVHEKLTDSYVCVGFKLVAADIDEEEEVIGFFSQIEDVRTFLKILFNSNFYDDCIQCLHALIGHLEGYPKMNLEIKTDWVELNSEREKFIESLRIREDELGFP
jgi:hypothetical protein